MAPAASVVTELDDDEIFYPVCDVEIAETDAHRRLMNYTVDALEIYYANDAVVYVSGNNLVYYNKSNMHLTVSPNCYVVYGVPKRLRNDYKIWKENGIVPRVVIDVISEVTPFHVETVNPAVHEKSIQIEEYFCFHLKGKHSQCRLLGFRREEGQYIPLSMENEDRIYSHNLGLYLVIMGEDFRFYNPRTEEYLRTGQETHSALKVAQEEIARLRAELEQLKRGDAAE